LIASKYHLSLIPCRECGVKALRYKAIEDKETLVGKTWGVRKMIIKCLSCHNSNDYKDYEQTKEEVKKFRSFFYVQ
jgi:hypothetical protein